MKKTISFLRIVVIPLLTIPTFISCNKNDLSKNHQLINNNETLILDAKEQKASPLGNTKLLINNDSIEKLINNKSNNTPIKQSKVIDNCELLEKKVVSNKECTEISSGDISLIIDSGAVKEDVVISISALKETTLPYVPDYMNNLTKQEKGYRLLPDGQKFEKDITLAISYDTSQIPYGYSPEDIYTFFYNELTGIWEQIERDSVDEERQIVYSRTNHFTDYINGILKTPETSDALAYTPTSIKDLQAANPLEGITMISPPEANNKGTANLSYPITIPQGRRGMQPNLNITYNSSGGSSWLGLGWDLSISSISVETRWGVPLYDPQKESETYLLDGETLVTGEFDDEGKLNLNKPTYQTEFKNRSGNLKQFYPRVEGAFRQILRHGTNPNNYWWEIIDKDGTRYFYGSVSGSGFDGSRNSILYSSDTKKNIAKWYLTKVIDTYGNTIEYKYQLKYDATKSYGQQLSLSNINYTGKGYDVLGYGEIEKGKYDIHFVLDNKIRPDLTSSGRYGFKEVNAYLLDRIEVKYNDTVIKEYFMGYKQGAFEKTLLCNIIEIYNDSAKHQRVNYANIGNNDDAYRNNNSDNVPITDRNGYWYNYTLEHCKECFNTINGVEKWNHNYWNGQIWQWSDSTDWDVECLVKCLTDGGHNNGSGGSGEGGGDNDSVTFSEYDLYEEIFKMNPFARCNYEDYIEDTAFIFLTHRFDYHNLPEELYGEPTYIGGSISKDDAKINILGKNIGLGNLGGSKTEGWNIGGGISLGVGYNIILKSLSAGGNYDRTNKDNSEGFVAFVDMNGDGYPDKLYKGNDGNLYYCPLIMNEYGFYFDNPIQILGPKAFNQSSSKSNNWGAEGSAEVVGIGGNFGYTWTDTRTSTNIYLSDVNADGLPDIVNNGLVYINHLEEGGNYFSLITPGETLLVGGTCFGDTIYADEEPIGVDPTIFDSQTLIISRIVECDSSNRSHWDYIQKCPDDNSSPCLCEVFDTIHYVFPKIYEPQIDLVRSWTAPYTGTIEIESIAELTDNVFSFDVLLNDDIYNPDYLTLNNIRKMNNVFDGVTLSIQKKDDNFLLVSKILNPDTVEQELDCSVNVNAGDMIFFRMQSNNSSKYDKVVWNPNIRYTSVDVGNGESYYLGSIDANRKKIFNFNYKDDFILSEEQKMIMPIKGTLKVEYEVNIENPLTEPMILKTIDSTTTLSYTSEYFDYGTYGDDYYFSYTYTLDSGDYVKSEIECPGQLNWSDIDINVKMYIESTTDTNYADGIIDVLSSPGDTIYKLTYYPAINKNIYQYMKIPSVAWQPDSTFYAQLKPALSLSNNASGNIKMVIKDGWGNFIDSTSYNVVNGTISSNYNALTLYAESNYKYYIDYYTKDTNLSRAITNVRTRIINQNNKTIQSGLYANYDSSYMKYGSQYRGWGQFGYKANDVSIPYIQSNLLHLSDIYQMDANNFSLDTNSINSYFEAEETNNSTYDLSNDGDDIDYEDNLGYNPEEELSIANTTIYNPLKDNFFIMLPDFENKCYKAYGDIYINKDTLSLEGLNSELNVELFPEDMEREFSVSSPENPIPITKPGTILTAVNKSSMNRGKGSTWGASLLGIVSAGRSSNHGEITLLSDFMDMNGDRYPDAVSEVQIQLSKPQGGLSTRKVNYRLGIDKSKYNSSGNTFGCSFLKAGKMLGMNPKISKIFLNGNDGLGGSISTSKNSTSLSFVDINGDGLPDKVNYSGKISLNYGNGFGNVERWNMSQFRESGSTSYGLNASLGDIPILSILGKVTNKVNTSLALGLGGSKNENNSSYMLLDINGDGLQDLVSAEWVRFNKGNGFSDYYLDLGLGQGLDKGVGYSVNGTGAITFGFTFGFLPVKTNFNPKVGGFYGYNETNTQMVDINNDGYLDFVVDSGDDGLLVRYSNIGKTNMLKSVENTTNYAIIIDYDLSKPSTYENPSRSWDMSSLKIYDGFSGDGSDTMSMTFEYGNKKYNRVSREDYGYDIVTTKEYNNSSVYRIKKEEYHNDNYKLANLKKKETILNGNNVKYQETITNYGNYEISTGEKVQDNMAHCFGSTYPAVQQEIVSLRDVINNNTITTTKNFEYSTFGNVKKYSDNNGVIVNIKYYSDYEYNLDGYDFGYVSPLTIPGAIPIVRTLVTEVNINNGERKRVANYYEAMYDKLNELRVYSSASNYSQYNYFYDDYGNIYSVTLPSNDAGQRLSINYVYDDTLHTYPVRTSNSYGYSSSAEYDYRWQKPLKTIDITGNAIEYTYDTRGRTKTIRGPMDTYRPYTIKYEYWDMQPVIRRYL
ncbi:MAG: hypothetical protein LBM25_04200, partial [Bacteroidales bacterium]|nr:hypothetical protein [Bacteroidales bacterium]